MRRLMSTKRSDTIVALSTPYGISAIGVIRLSGSSALNIADRLFAGRVQLYNVPSHTTHHGTIVVPETKEPIDEVLIALFRAPNSYTGEDLVEISCHGNPNIIDSIIKTAVNVGARMATEGEFTRRALLNGKIDLIQAEATLDLIVAQGTWAQRNAYLQLVGKFSQKMKEITDALVNVLTQVEANLDFPEDEEWQDMTGIKDAIKKINVDIANFLNSGEEGIVMREGQKIAIVGKPNVGKSSLFNRLLGIDRVIVAETPGTTRDFIEENLIVKDLRFRLIDTAGLGWAKDQIEEQGMTRTRKVIMAAQLLLVLFDAADEINEHDLTILKATNKKKRLIIFNKCDLPPRLEKQKILRLTSNLTGQMEVSARTGAGIEELKEMIFKILSKPAASNGYIITRRRHLEALKRANEALTRASTENFNETIALELRTALDALGDLTGKVTAEDILNKIFAEFCIGK